MPEGHTIHRLARDLTKHLGGHEIETSSPQDRFSDGAALLDGRTLEHIDAWGKHLPNLPGADRLVRNGEPQRVRLLDLPARTAGLDPTARPESGPGQEDP